MTKQNPAGDLFSHADRLAEARAAKAAGMQQSGAGADEEWSTFMLGLVRQACLANARFTSDDVFDLRDAAAAPPDTHDSRAFGPVMMRAAKAGWCRKLNTTQPSRRRSLHASPRAIWESLIYQPTVKPGPQPPFPHLRVRVL